MIAAENQAFSLGFRTLPLQGVNTAEFRRLKI